MMCTNASLLLSLTMYYFAGPLQRFPLELFVIECDNLYNNARRMMWNECLYDINFDVDIINSIIVLYVAACPKISTALFFAQCVTRDNMSGDNMLLWNTHG